MRYALIDNSTLTSVQRILGDIPVKNLSIVNNDILSLENYIQALLFYDELISIDDYIDEFKEHRTKFFPNIKFISKSWFDYDSFVAAANKATKEIIVEVNSGKISDSDFKSYFDKLKMTYWFTWDQNVSVFYLTQKMLLGNNAIDEDTFAGLQASIYEQGAEYQYSDFTVPFKRTKLLDSNGNELSIKYSGENNRVSKAFQALASSLNWMSQRTAFYALTADYLNADLFIQPIRQEFLNNVLNKLYPNYQVGKFNGLISSTTNDAEQLLKKVLSNDMQFHLTLKIPMFSASFVNKTNDPSKLIEYTMEVREQKVFLEARNKLRELNLLLENGNRLKYIKDINLLRTDIEDNFKKILDVYKIGANQGFSLSSLKFLWSWVPVLGSLEIPSELDIRLKNLEYLKDLIPNKGFKGVFRNLIDDLTQVERLGSFRDKLTSKIKYDRDASESTVKTIPEKFKNNSSHWTHPM